MAVSDDFDCSIMSGSIGQHLFELAFETMPVGMCFTTLDRRPVYCNPALCKFLGRGVDDLKSIDITELTHPEDADLHATLHRRLLAGEIDRYALDKRYMHSDGRTVWAHLQVVLVRDEHEEPRMLLTQLFDINERMEQAERLRWHATHDPLTGFVNRTELFERLRKALVRARDGVGFAVMFMDMDGFKDINDRHGHSMGDRVLKHVAEQVAQVLRTGDTAARIGGDEFVLLVEDVDASVQVGAMADRIHSLLRRGMVLDGARVDLSVSIGIVLARDGEPDELLKRADAALYAAKRGGRNRHVLADAPIRESG